MSESTKIGKFKIVKQICEVSHDVCNSRKLQINSCFMKPLNGDERDLEPSGSLDERNLEPTNSLDEYDFQLARSLDEPFRSLDERTINTIISRSLQERDDNSNCVRLSDCSHHHIDCVKVFSQCQHNTGCVRSSDGSHNNIDCFRQSSHCNNTESQTNACRKSSTFSTQNMTSNIQSTTSEINFNNLKSDENPIQNQEHISYIDIHVNEKEIDADFVTDDKYLLDVDCTALLSCSYCGTISDVSVLTTTDVANKRLSTASTVVVDDYAIAGIVHGDNVYLNRTVRCDNKLPGTLLMDTSDDELSNSSCSRSVSPELEVDSILEQIRSYRQSWMNSNCDVMMYDNKSLTPYCSLLLCHRNKTDHLLVPINITERHTPSPEHYFDLVVDAMSGSSDSLDDLLNWQEENKIKKSPKEHNFNELESTEAILVEIPEICSNHFREADFNHCDDSSHLHDYSNQIAGSNHSGLRDYSNKSHNGLLAASDTNIDQSIPFLRITDCEIPDNNWPLIDLEDSHASLPTRRASSLMRRCCGVKVRRHSAVPRFMSLRRERDRSSSCECTCTDLLQDQLTEECRTPVDLLDDDNEWESSSDDISLSNASLDEDLEDDSYDVDAVAFSQFSGTKHGQSLISDYAKLLIDTYLPQCSSDVCGPVSQPLESRGGNSSELSESSLIATLNDSRNIENVQPKNVLKIDDSGSNLNPSSSRASRPSSLIMSSDNHGLVSSAKNYEEECINKTKVADEEKLPTISNDTNSHSTLAKENLLQRVTYIKENLWKRENCSVNDSRSPEGELNKTLFEEKICNNICPSEAIIRSLLNKQSLIHPVAIELPVLLGSPSARIAIIKSFSTCPHCEKICQDKESTSGRCSPDVSKLLFKINKYVAVKLDSL